MGRQVEQERRLEVKLTSISASSVQTFESCTSRYYHEYVERAPSPPAAKLPASLGTTVHDALERYVREVFIDKTKDESLERLIAYHKQEFMKEFKRPPSKGDTWYDQGKEMLERWWSRTDLTKVEVLMVERKMEVPITTSAGPLPYRFIFDRLDLITHDDGKKTLRVVDYKSWRKNMSPEGLRQKPQARMYGFAIAAAFKEYDADYVEVVFDQLRYQEVGITLSREDNLETWRYIKAKANEILATEGQGKETLNEECQFCIKKSTCKALTRNVAAGGIAFLAGDRDKLAGRLLALEGAKKAIGYAIDEIIEAMVSEAQDSGEIEYDTEHYEVAFRSRTTQSYSPDTVREIVGDVIFGSLPNCNNGTIEKLLDGDSLSSGQKSLLRSSVKISIADPKPKVTRKMIPKKKEDDG